MLRRTALALSILVAACGDDGSAMPDANTTDAAIPDAPPRETVMRTAGLVPGELVEGIMTGGPGDLVLITLSAPLPDIGWNIHGHANGSTQIAYEEHAKMAVTYAFAPGSQADWYLLVRNEGNANLEVQVKIELYGTVTWEWQ